MDINDRIKNIGEHFAVFNVHNGAVCVGVNLPEKWTLFDVDTICGEFGIQIETKGDTTFFLCDITRGFEPVFDAVDFIIEQNEALEQKTNLLKTKVDELRVLFEKEPLERLKSLRFTFDESIETLAKDLPFQVDIKQQIKKTGKKKDETVPSEATETEIETGETKSQKRVKKKNNAGDSSLMNFVKNEIDNE